MKIAIIILLALIILVTPKAIAQNHVLSLDGDGDYVEITDSESLNAVNSQVTMEAWIKATAFTNQWMPVIFKGDDSGPSSRSYTLWLASSGHIHLSSTPTGKGHFVLNSPDGLIDLNRWYHVTGVIDAKRGWMKIFLNGIEVANAFFGPSIHLSTLPLRIGGLYGKGPLLSPFAGQIDEVRIWNIALTEEQISDNMFKPLRGDESGLVAYWQFENGNGIISDVTGNGNDGKFFGDATRVVSALPTRPTREELHQSYLSSLKLELSVRRRKPDTFEDVLAITPRRVPKSSIFTTPRITVQIEIQDEQKKLLETLEMRTEETMDWAVPEPVKGELTISGKYTNAKGLTQQAEFTCQAHSTVPLTKKVGHFQTYDVTNGLSGSAVYDILQDNNGYLWFALAYAGVCRYDGRRFTSFTQEDGLPSNNISTIYQDSRGNLWFGSYDQFTYKGAGVCKYDGATFTTYTTKDGLANDAITAIYEDNKGHLWFGNKRGVSEFDGVTFRNYTAKEGFPVTEWVSVATIAQDRQGNLWFGHGPAISGYGASRYDSTSFKTFTTQHGLAGNAVTSIIADRQGDLWFAARDGGVSRYDGQSFVNLTTKDGLCDNGVWDVYETQNGDLWFATWGGVSRYRDGQFHSFTAKDGLPITNVLATIEDREGNLWFATGDGASQYDDSVTNIALEIWFREPVMDLAGNIWVLASGQPCRYDGENLTTFGPEDGLPPSNVRCLAKDQEGNIWMGYRNGDLAKYSNRDGGKFRTFGQADGLPGHYFSGIYEDRDGLLWLGVEGEIYTYDGLQFVKVAGKEELGGGGEGINPKTEGRRGNMWFTQAGYGVYSRYDGKKFTHFTSQNGLPSDLIYSIIEDRNGNIWLGGYGGLCRYDGQNFQIYTTEDGLTENLVYRIFEDRDGSLWIGLGTGGVQKFDGRNFQTFTTDDGLLKNIAENILEDESGNIIFPTTKGITIYTPPKEKIPPPVWVTEVVADKVYPEPKEIEILSTTPRLSFAYYGMSFKTHRMRYNYMLQGYDADWIAT